MTDEKGPASGKPESGSQTGRRPLVAANWKMNKTNAEASAFLDAFIPDAGARSDVEIVICPPYTALRTVVERTAGTAVITAAQNMHERPSGAFTGEVSAPMLTEIGVGGVVLGHSERRELFGEKNQALQLKVPAALAAGLLPILCVGETESEREAGETERKLRHQVQADLAGVEDERLTDVVIAYEPIWAIGTGNTATPEQAQEAIAFVRALLADRSPAAAERIRLLYGGSVNPGNAAELLGQHDIDGALVGGASLDPKDFAAIVAATPRAPAG
jgi:triosephosphate isomerase (TIM)